MPVRFAFWMSHVFSMEILEHYLDMVFRHCVLCFSHASAMSMHFLPYHQHCTLGEITRRIKGVIPIMRVVFCYLNSKWVDFLLCKCPISLKKVLQKGKTLTSLYWAKIYIVNGHKMKVKHADNLLYSVKSLKTRIALMTAAPIHVVRSC